MQRDANGSVIYQRQSGPLLFSLETAHPTEPHWHKQIELLYILRGHARVHLREEHFSLRAGQLLAVNPFELHSVDGDSYVTGLFRLDLDQLDPALLAGLPYRLDCNGATAQSPELFAPLKRMLARIVKAGLAGTGSAMMYQGLAYELLSLLAQNFGVQDDGRMDASRNPSRMEEMLNYIGTHYREHLALSDVADHFYLTTPYASKLFKQTMGTNFTDYVRQLRLAYAMRDLNDPTVPIEQVAERNGFANTRSFVAVFRQQYGTLPSKYRKQHLRDAAQDTPAPAPLWSGQSQHHYLGDLAQYLDVEIQAAQTRSVLVETPTIALGLHEQPLPHTYQRTLGIGKAKGLLFAPTQELLRRAQRDIGFSYITFHGLLDDEMMIYGEDAAGRPELSFSYVDMAFDFLLEIGLRPLLELSFMPSALALENRRVIFYQQSVLSPPNDPQKWAILVEGLLHHLETRYGAEEVRRWPILLWNKPESPLYIHGFGSCEEYFAFYQATWRAVKRVDQALVMGCPGLMGGSPACAEWLIRFTRLCQEGGCVPEFLTLDYYPMVANEFEGLSDADTHAQQYSRNLTYQTDPDCFVAALDEMHKTMKNYHLPYRQLFVGEWNSTISHRELLNDTAFKSAYIVKNVIEAFDRVQAMGYWVLSDFIEEVRMAGQLFHGGLGLATYNGICKPAYYAYMLLARLGDKLEARGPGYLVSRRQDNYQIILVNYIHYSELYAAGELFDMTFTNRYTPFPHQSGKRFVLSLQGLSQRRYTCTEQVLNRRVGSSYDKWVELGAHPLDTREEAAYLQSASMMQLNKQTLDTEDGCLTLDRDLEPFEVRFLELTPIYD